MKGPPVSIAFYTPAELTPHLDHAGDFRAVITPGSDRQASVITISHHSAEEPPWQHDEDAALLSGGDGRGGEEEARGEPGSVREPTGASPRSGAAALWPCHPATPPLGPCPASLSGNEALALELLRAPQ